MNKNTILVVALVALALVCPAFADFTNGMNYYIKSGTDGKIHLSQSEATQSCSAVSGCTGASFTNAASANAWLVKTLNDRWSDGKTLVFDTDIDFGGFASSTKAGECDAQLVSLPYPQGGLVDGNGKTVKNLCYVHDVATGAMVEPVGFFSQNVDTAFVANLNIENVRIVVSDSRDDADKDLDKDGNLFYPVGSLFGSLKNAVVEKVTVKNVYVKAPFAGGVVGFAKLSTIREVQATENIVVENDVDLSEGTLENSTGKGIAASNYAGSSLMDGYSAAVFPSEYSVFLGGIVGVAMNDSIYKSQVCAKIEDRSGLTTRSALGGLAGLVSAEDEDFSYGENALVKVDGATEGPSITEISGGRAMGGFFGEISNTHKAVSGFVGSKFDIVNSSIDSLKITKAGSDSVYAGGFVGVFKSSDNGRLTINKSVARVDIEDKVESEGSFDYFAGGIIGATNTCNISYDVQNLSGYASIVNSKAFGKIHIEASSEDVPNAKVKAFLGGVGGFVCFTADGTALKNDTSSVVVKSDVTTPSDSIFVGGFVGLANVYNDNVVLTISDLLFNGEVSAQLAEDKVSLGGVLGAFKQNQMSRISFENVRVENKKNPVVKLMSDGASKKSSVARVGGVCGNCYRAHSFSLVSVVGDIVSDDKNFAGDSLLVGGIVGRVESSNEIYVDDTYSIGNVSVASDSKAKIGYIAGYASFVNSEVHDFSRNYHFSGSDGVDGFGYVTNGSDITSTWKNLKKDEKKKDVFSHNVRNGSATSLSTNGKNGTMTVAEMQTADFADFLNEDLEEDVWNFDADLNDKLPFFGTLQPSPELPEIPVYKVKFMNDDVELLTVDVDSNVVPQYVGDEPTKASTAQFTYTFNGWTPTPVAATEDAVYKASFKSTVNQYKISFVDGKKIIQEKDFDYGATPECDYTPTREATAQYTFKFKEWNPELVPVMGTATYQAVFDTTVNKFDVVFISHEGDTLSVQKVEYGSAAIAPEDVKCDKHKFDHWDTEFDVVVKNLVVTAIATDIPKSSSSLSSSSYSSSSFSSSSQNSSSSVSSSSMSSSSSEPPSSSSYSSSSFSSSSQNSSSSVSSSSMSSSSSEPPSSSSLSSSSFSSSSQNSSSSELPRSSSSYSSSSFSSSSQNSSSSELPRSSSSYSSSSYSSSSSEMPKSSSSRGGKKKLEIAKADIEYSGKNAIRFNYVANVVNTVENTTARIKIVGEDGVYLDTLLFDSLVTDVAKGDWQLAPAPIGSYEVVLTVKNANDSVTTKNKFNVDGKIVVEPRSWQMVSLAAIEDGVLKKDGDAAIYWWDEKNPIGDYWQYRSFDFGETPEATQGFWYGTSQRDTLVLKAETPTKNSKVAWKLENHYSGWNMIANPHGWQIDLEKGKGGKVKFWRWNAETAEYEIPSTLGPYEAVWAQVEKSTTWEVSSQPVFDIKPADTKPLARAGVKSAWSLRAVLADEFGKKDSWNFLGAGDASENVEEPPAGMGDHVTLSIVEGKNYLAKSLKPVSDEYNWNMQASATGYREATLVFEGANELAAQGLSLYVTVNGRTQTVNGDEPLKLSLGTDPTPVKVRVSKAALVVSSSKLSEFKTISVGNRLQVNFMADEALAGGMTHVELVSLQGQVMASASAKTLAGANTLNLETPKSGVYMLRVKTGNLSAVSRILVR